MVLGCFHAISSILIKVYAKMLPISFCMTIKERFESSDLCENTRACLDPKLKITAKLLLLKLYKVWCTFLDPLKHNWINLVN